MTPGDSRRDNVFTLLLCGDVMTGRGVDQILPHPSDPVLYEPAVKDARDYVELAERASGPMPRPVDFAYIWGEALEELNRVAPDLRIVNLETAVTKSSDYWRGKGINYRMNPENVPCLAAGRIDCCALANNHVLDWGYAGLDETLHCLAGAGIQTTGAGHNRAEAERPAVFDTAGKGRLIVFSFGCESSGIPRSWAAAPERAGVNLIDERLASTVPRVKATIEAIGRTGDLVVASIHWGGNWGYSIPREQRELAHRLIDECAVDVVHGHSSHHVKGIEVYKDKPILYGCGDFLTDYEGIPGYEQFRDDLGLMYFVGIDATSGRLADLQMTPTQIKRFRVNRASRADSEWLARVLNREGAALGTSVDMTEQGRISLRWE